MQFINEIVDRSGQDVFDVPIPPEYTPVRIPILIQTLRTNSEKHKVEYTELVENYKKAYVERLKEMNREFKRDWKTASNAIGLFAPANYTKDYEKIITQLEMAAASHVCLNNIEFSRYVMDDWGWKNEYALNSAIYASKIGEKTR